MLDEPKTYSIMLRLRRVTTEYAYVNVPVTDAIMKIEEPGGQASIDFERFAAQGIRYGGDPDVKWIREAQDVTPHPMQTPLPEGYPLKSQWSSVQLPRDSEGR
jgi:hypothetical protein